MVKRLWNRPGMAWAAWGAVAGLAFSAPAAPPKADFHVAADGRDDWSGRLAAPNAGKTDGPFASLARARNAVRGLKKDRPITVLIRGGTYRLADAVWFGPADSGGGPDAPVTYAAPPGETPVLSGAWRVRQRLSNKPGSTIWSVKLPAGSKVTDLHLDGRRLTRARMPNEGFFSALRKGCTRTTFFYEKGPTGPVPDAEVGFAVVRPYQWCEEHIPLKRVDHEKRQVTLARPCGYKVSPGGYGAPGHFRIENVAAALDQPGEWCFNPDTRLLHVIPPEGVDPNEAELLAAATPVLVALNGEPGKDRWVEDVAFRGLTFARTARTAKPEWGAYGASAVRFRGARRCRIEACRFVDLGGCGATLWKECVRCRVAGCEFARAGETAVTIFDYLGEGPPASRGNVVDGNHIHHGGAVRRNAVGISLSMTRGNRVTGNRIDHMPYSGITAAGTRPEYWKPANAPKLEAPFTPAKIRPFVPLAGNVVAGNRVDHVMQEMGDGGAIYFWGVSGPQPNVIEANLIHDVGLGEALAVGLYLDDQMADVVVRRNLVVRADWGLHLHGTSRCRIESNVFARTRVCDVSVQPEKYNTEPMLNVIRRNVFYMGSGGLYRRYNFEKGNRPLKEMDRNLYWRGAGKELTLGIAKGFDARSVVADPLFVAPGEWDYRLRPDSPARRLGIEGLAWTGPHLRRPSARPRTRPAGTTE